jgi:hypothetical protein
MTLFDLAGRAACAKRIARVKGPTARRVATTRFV